eukprot:gene9252-10041_t
MKDFSQWIIIELSLKDYYYHLYELIAMLRTAASAQNISLSSKPVFYAAVIDYYSAGEEKQYYEHHFFVLQIFIEQQEYRIERSYASFCELDLKLRHQYPRTELPKLPLSGISAYEKKHQRRFPILGRLAESSKKKKEVTYDSVHQHHIMSVVAKTAALNLKSASDRRVEALMSVADEGWQMHHSFDRGSLKGAPSILTKRQDPTENFMSKKLPLTAYLQELLSLQEILHSDVFLQFLDEEIPDHFLYAYPPPVFSSKAASTEPSITTSARTTTSSPALPDKDTIIPLSTYFLLTPEVLDNLEIYLLLQNESLLTRKLKKECFEVSVPLTSADKVYYLFFTDLYDIALTITLDEVMATSIASSSSFSTSSLSPSTSKTADEGPSSLTSPTKLSERTSKMRETTTQAEDKRQIILSNHHRYPCHEKVQWGMIDLTTLPNCQRGVLTFRFDNTYSKWRSKQLHFIVKSFPNEMIEENIERTVEVQQMKQTFQQKRLFLRQVFHTLSNYLVLTKNNILPPYAARMLKTKRLLEEQEENGEEGKQIDEERRKNQNDLATSFEADHDTEKLLQASSPLSALPYMNNDDEITMDELFSLQRMSVVAQDIPTTTTTTNRSSITIPSALTTAFQNNNTPPPSSNTSAEREKILQQLQQKELFIQIRQLMTEKKSLLSIVQEKDALISQLQQEKETLEEDRHHLEEKVLSYGNELGALKHELDALSEKYQQSLEEQSRNNQQYQQPVLLFKIEELMSFSNVEEVKRHYEELVVPHDKDEKSSSTPSPNVFSAVAVDNFDLLFSHAKDLQKKLEDTQRQAFYYQEEVVPKLKSERKQLKVLGNQLKESLQQREKEIDFINHDKELVIQENLDLKSQVEQLQQRLLRMQQEQRNTVSSTIVLPQPSTASSLTTMSSMASSFEENPRVNVVSVPEKITVTKEDLQSIVLTVHESEEPEERHDINEEPHEEAEEVEEEENVTMVEDPSGRVYKHLGYQEFDVDEGMEDGEAASNSAIPNYHIIDGYASEKKLVKVNFEEDDVDDFQMAMEVMKDTFKDIMPSWFKR